MAAWVFQAMVHYESKEKHGEIGWVKEQWCYQGRGQEHSNEMRAIENKRCPPHLLKMTADVCMIYAPAPAS